MRFAIELGGTARKPRRKKASLSRVVMIVVGLHMFVIGAIFICEGIAHLNIPEGLSRTDAIIIRNHFRAVTPPAPVLMRILNVCRQLKQVFQIEPEYVLQSSQVPVRITTLIPTRTDIRIVTEAHGIHIYRRATRTWFVIGEDETDDSLRLTDPEVDDVPRPKSDREVCSDLGVVRIKDLLCARTAQYGIGAWRQLVLMRARAE